MRIILSNLDTIVLNVKYNLVSAVSKKRKRFSRGRRWSSHESGQNWEAKDRLRTATYTRPLLIICHRLSTGRAKIFLRQFSLFFFTRFAFFSPSLSILFPTSFSFLFLLWSRRRTVIDDNTRHLFLSFYSPGIIGQQKQRFSHLAILHPFTLLYTRDVSPIDASISTIAFASSEMNQSHPFQRISVQKPLSKRSCEAGCNSWNSSLNFTTIPTVI